MKKFLLLIIMIFCFFFFKINIHAHTFITGTHYFGTASPFNFWNSDELYLTDQNFKKIKNDCFNTIILTIPWREFTKDASCYKKLKFYFQKAKNNNLNVILRVSYFWDLYKSKVSLPQLFLKLIVNKKTFNNWLSYLKKINNISSKYDNFLFAFISWEDFWLYTDKNILEKFPEYNKFLDLYRSFVLKKYGTEVRNFPAYRSCDFKYALEYFDYLLVDKLYKHASKIFPELSIEARVDNDPIYKNGKLDKWFIHHQTFLPSRYNIATVYYAPFLGQKNIGDEISCTKAIHTFDYLLKNFKKLSQHRDLFIDQFNFISFVPNLKNNTKIKENEITCFLKKSKHYLLKYTIGYSIWNYKYYRLNMIYNSAFENKLKGWDTSQGKILKIKKNNVLKLNRNSFIKQNISKYLFYNYRNYGNFKLCFKAFTDKKNSILKFQLNSNQKFKKIKLQKQIKEYCFNFPTLKKNPNIFFSVDKGNAYLDDIYFYNFIDNFGLYNLSDKKLWYTDNVIRLNRDLNTVKYLTEGIYKDKWMGKTCKIKLFTNLKNPVLKIEFFVPKFINNKIAITAYCKNTLIKKFNLKKGVNRLKLNKLNNCKNIELKSDFIFQPNKIFKNSNDKRELSVIINNLRVE